MTVVGTGTTSANVTGTIAKGTGSNRVLLVVLTVGNSAAVTANLSTTTVTYGGRSLTPIAWTSTQRSAIWAGYLKEADIVAATNTTISATISSASIAGSKIAAAVFKDALSGAADNPIQSYATGLKDAYDTAAVTISTPANNVTVPANGYGIVAVSGNQTTATAYTWSPAAYEGTAQEWVNTTTHTAGGSSHAGGASDVVETSIGATPSGTSRLSLVAVTLKPAVLDATAPSVGTVTITSPAANTGTYVPANVTFTAAITEPESTPTCEYTTNGSTWSAGVISGATSPYTCTATVTGLTGAVTLNIRASSLGGGPTPGTALPRTVDTTAPVTSAAPAAGTYGSDQSVTLTPVDAGVGVASTVYCVDTTNVCVPGTTYSGAVAVTGTPGLPVTKYLRYRATDLFNAIETVKSSQYIIDQTNATPTLSIAAPNGVDDVVTVGASYNITYSLADSDNVVTAAFYYDTNSAMVGGTAITGACATAAEGTSVTCAWNTTGVPTGSYYIYGMTNDGVNP
ncbi:MAG: hypothetical protein Q7U75_06565, partial [Desulfobacterales bacterium]|nr:hypothetical protein [Desulfobacterales bacterium]